MTNYRPYSHVARFWHNPDTNRAECLTCGRPITGVGKALRHVGEAFQPLIPSSGHADAVNAAVDAATRALEEMLSDRVSDRDRARAVVERLYADGALNPNRAKWKRPLRPAA